MESSLEISFDSTSSLDHALLTWALPLDAVQVDTFTSNRLLKVTAMDKWRSHAVPRLFSLFTRGGDIHDLIPQVDDSSLYLDWGLFFFLIYLLGASAQVYMAIVPPSSLPTKDWEYWGTLHRSATYCIATKCCGLTAMVEEPSACATLRAASEVMGQG